MSFRYSTALFNSFLTALKTDMTDGVIKYYTGSQPASPDSAATGTYMGAVTLAGGAWTAGSPTNGLEFDTPSGTTIDKIPADEWKFVCETGGTIGWGRFVSNSASDTGGASTTLARIDFSVGITSGDCRMSKVTYAAGETAVIQSLTIPLSNIS